MRQFDELLHADRATLSAIVQAIDLATWSTALRGASEELSQRVLQLLGPRTAQRLQTELSRPKAVRLDEVESAQKHIIEAAHRLTDSTGPVMQSARERQHA